MGQVHGTNIKTNYLSSSPITAEALTFINKYSDKTLLEIGCGSGIYAKLLRNSGLTVIATDACKIINTKLKNPNKRMAKFTNKRAINIIEKNAVSAVRNYGQQKNVSLFLSFPLPDVDNSEMQYDENALREFKGNKFFLTACYSKQLSNSKNYESFNVNISTGSSGLHKYLAENFTVEDKILLKTINVPEFNKYIYLIYLKKKSEMNNNSNIQKAKQFSVGDYVMIRDLPHTYVIFRINQITSRITLYNLSSKSGYSENIYKTVNPDQLVKKRSYSNTVRGRTTYPIPDDIQNIINKSKNK
jgi:hypothetical protein